MSGARTAYDEFAYPSQCFPQTHPNRLAVIATLLGLAPAPPARCRVLEVGCGDAGNLIALALGSPEARCVGFDLAESAVEQGRSWAGELGLKNIELFQADLMAYEPDEPFDYIIAHGFMSWVPPPVQRRLLELCQSALAPQGVAFVSYNAYPGFHARRMLREMMMFHCAGAADPRGKIDRARELLHFIREGYVRSDEFAALLRTEAEWVLNRDSEAVLFHDDLAEINIPFYVHQFAGLAAEHDLQFLAEADYYEMNVKALAPAVSAALQKLPNIILREQYLDFLKCRRFRQTLLVRDDVSIDREPKPDRVRSMFVASPARRETDAAIDLAPGVTAGFAGPRGGAMRIDHALTKAAMLVLESMWPRPIPFAELVAGARQLLGDAAGPVSDEDESVLAEVLLETYGSGIVELHLHRPSWVTAVSERPVASPLLRLQLRRGANRVTSLRPINMLMDVPFYQSLFQLLDGTRDRPALVAELRRQVESGALTLPEDAADADLPGLVEAALARAASEATLAS